MHLSHCPLPDLSSRELQGRDLQAYNTPVDGFPPYSCDADLSISPFHLIGPVATDGMLCYTVEVVTPTKKSPCNLMDFYKLAIDVRKFAIRHLLSSTIPTPHWSATIC